MATLKAAIGGASGGVSAALGAGKIGDLIVGSSFHEGGTVGSEGAAKSMSASLFANAPRYHNGTPYVGLRPDEVPAILQTGEQVLSRSQVAQGRNNRGTTNVTFVLPGVSDSRGFNRSISQNAGRMRDVLGVRRDD